jgi:hypothetical protein
MNETDLMAIVVEALLYYACPEFCVEAQRDDGEIIEVIGAIKSSNPDIFDQLELQNKLILCHKDEAESPLISNILQLLDDIVEVEEISE